MRTITLSEATLQVIVQAMRKAPMPLEISATAYQELMEQINALPAAEPSPPAGGPIAG